MRQKAKTPHSFFFTSLLFISLLIGCFSISNKVLYPISSNIGFKTDYYMSFTPDQTYSLTALNLKLTIPIEYQLSQIDNELQCYISRTGIPNSYEKMIPQNCYTQPNTNSSYSIIGEIIIKIDSISSSSPVYFVFRNIVNPTTDSSSFFGLCIRSSTHLLECDKQFKMLTFTSAFTTINNGLSINTNPLIPVVGQGTTYYLKLRSVIVPTIIAYDLNLENVQLRVVFPNQFYSSNPICSLLQYNSVTGTYAAIQTQTTVTPSKSFSIECKKIKNFKSLYLFYNVTTLSYELNLKIQNIENPLYSDSFSGLYIQICRQGRNQIIQNIQFSQVMNIQQEQLDGSVKQSNLMRNATNVYYFYFTHDLNYAQNSKIKLTIGNNIKWYIHDVKLMFGFTNSTNFTSQITNTAIQATAEITNYALASKQAQQIIAVNLTSADSAGDHIVKIQTFIDDKPSGSWNGIVKLNSTWGSFNRLSFSAVQYPTKLPVDKTGPLQFTVFLNYELPQSQNIQNGSMIISMTPPIATPDPDIYGKVKCYFKATKQAANCTYDNTDPTKTKITLVSPPYQEFQFSQIPIIITTEGGIDEDHLGLTISPIVQRYKFDVQFYLYNSSIIPSQVLYTNWVADAIQLPGTLTGKAISWECNQWTALHFNLITPLMNSVQQRLMFHFLADQFNNNAWATGLGYNVDQIYKEYPCVIVGMVGTGIKCDLYTYSNIIGPYNKQHISSDYFGSFIMVYGFEEPVPTGSSVDIYLPGIKLSNQVGANARVGFSILQQTPGQTQPYIQLYHQNITLFTTLNTPTVVSSSQAGTMGQIQVQTSNSYVITWNPVSNANVAYIKYDFSKYLPSMSTTFNTCSGSTCYSSGYPNNWMVQIPAAGASGAVSSPFTLTTSVAILSMPQINTLIDPYPVKITTYDANGNTLQIINIQNNYIPQPMLGGSFNLLDSASTMYSGLKQWYEVSFDSSLATTSTYPFIRLKLSSELKFSRPEQCESTTIQAFNQSGIICNIVSGTNDRQLIVWNIKAVNTSTTYQIKVRLQTSAPDHTVVITPKVDVLVNHNQSLVDSLVSERQLMVLTQSQLPIMAKPDQFKIHNPQILNEEIRINYIGRLFIDFQATAAMTTTLKIKLPNHRYNMGIWKTPNQLDTDPVVCMLNGVRFYCNPVNLPYLSITINSASIKAGSNRLQIDTEYIAPYNGLVFPDCAGNYPIYLSTINPTTLVQTLQHTFYIYIHPAPLEDIQIASIVKDINTQSVYLVNFTIADAISTVAANHDPANYSRIFIEFPTIMNGQRVFLDNLGGYQGVLNERVGCAFLIGATYAVAQATNPLNTLLQCRLIPPEIPGAPVKVQVINYAGLYATVDSLGLWIFKVWNPAISFNSVEIKVKINHYSITGEVYPTFESDFNVFLDPRTQNPSPANYPSSQSQLTNFFDMAKDVGDYGKISMKAETINAGAVLPFYMLVKLPRYLPVENQQIAPAFSSCPTANFQYCVSSPDVNYVLVKTTTNPSFFDINIKDYPLGISQVDSFFYSMIIQSGRYVGNIEYIISEQKRWPDILGTLTYNFIQPVGLLQKAVVSKQQFHLAISFTTANYIPVTGTIEVSFPLSVTKIYPYCRSAYANGSLLLAQSGASGQIGCSVQGINNNKWVITGFAQVLPLTNIIISGYIDLPSSSGPLGLAQIITYADNHQTNIYDNGSRIDYGNPYFALTVDNSLAMNPNQNIFLTQRDVVRAGDIGEFRVLVKPGQILTPTGYLKLYFMKADINAKVGGFSTILTQKKVCQFIDISTQDRIGCQVTLEDTTVDYVRVAMRTFENLLTSKTYELRLSTQKYSYPAINQGIIYPTVPSTYKIDVQMKYTAVSTTTIQQLYLDVYGPQFASIKVTQHNYIQNQYNVYWFEIQPTVSIEVDHQIVLEFPTKSNDGLTNLFSYNLGLNEYENGNLLMTDVFDSIIDAITIDNTFMKCNIFHGDATSGMSAKIVCGDFKYQIDIGQTLRFAVGIVNPFLASTQLSIPIMIYSVDPVIFTRTNFNLIQGAGYVYDTSNILSKAAYAATTSGQLQFPNDDFLIGDAHTFDLLAGDSFIVKFGFPLRVNDKKVGGCKDPTKATIYGDAYYHQRLRTVVCKLTATLPAQLTPTAATLLIESFYTPWYLLASSQQKLYAIAHYYSTTTSQVIVYTTPFPILAPRWVFSAAMISTLTMQPRLLHNTQCQRDDYVFTIQLDSGGALNLNLQYTRLIGIVFPLQTTVDFTIWSRDCVQHTSSQIQVRLCQINLIARTIYIQIVPGIYSNDKIIAIETKGLALRNPCLVPAPNINQFTVNFFSWENITASDKRANNRVYMTMDVRNILTTALTYVVEPSNAANAYFYPFEWVDVPHQRYFNQFHQFKANQYSPFKFDLLLTTAIASQAIGSYNTLTLYYGDKFDVNAPEDYYIDDMKTNTQLCFLRNTRVSQCFNDLSTGKITMYFEFDLPTTQWINVYFSVQDPRNLEINGFQYNGTDSDIAAGVYLQLQQFSAANSYIFKPSPFEAKQTNVNPGSTQLPQRAIVNGLINWAHSIPNQLNLIDMTFTINSSITDIKGLKFEIPLIDQFGAQIFSNPVSAFMDLANGDQYPCGNNDPANAASGRAKCYLFHGQNTIIGGLPTPGRHASIVMTDFKYTTQIKARLLMRNPDAGKWFTIITKAYKGASGPQNSIIGHQYVGYWKFFNVFLTQLTTVGLVATPAATTTSYVYPANPALGAPYTLLNPLWMDSTSWMVTGSVPSGSGAAGAQYVFFQGYLNDYDVGLNEPQVCQVDWTVANTMSDDMIIYKSRQLKQQRVFFIKTWVAGPWQINYYKCKHFMKNIKVYYHNTKILQTVIEYSILFSDFDYLSHTLSTLRYYDIMRTRTFIELDITTSITQALARGLVWQDEIDYYMLLTTNGVITFDSISRCTAMGGFNNKEGQPVGCSTISTTQVLITKFNELIPTLAGTYIIRFDVEHYIATSYTFSNTVTVQAKIYAGLDAYNNGLQYMFYVDSNGYAPKPIDEWTSQGNQGWYYYTSTADTFFINHAPLWSTITQYTHLYHTSQVDVRMLSFQLTASLLSFTIQLEPLTTLTIMENQNTALYLRFVFQGVYFNCGSPGTMSGRLNGGASQSMTSGLTCDATNKINYFIYDSGLHSRTAGAIRSMSTMFGNGPNWVPGQVIKMSGTVNVNTVTDLSETRDWIGLKVLVNTAAYQYQSYNPGYDGTNADYLHYINRLYKGYGQGFFYMQTLFSSGVTISALSNLYAYPTQLQIVMNYATVAFGRGISDKILLLEFNTGSTVIFPYVNNTGIAKNQRIECNCMTSAQANFNGANTYIDLQCFLKLPQGTYSYTAISLDVPVPLFNYVKCFFPGFVAPGAMTLSVKAKLLNKGINLNHYPNTPGEYGGFYSSPASSGFTFVAGTTPTAISITQTPSLYDGSFTSNILGNFNVLGGYKLDVSLGTSITTPIFYIDFQKGGPIPDTNMCVSPGVYDICRLYYTYRNIMVVKYSNPSSIGHFESFNAQMPIVKQYDSGSDYNLKIYAKQPTDLQYTYGDIKTRITPANLKATNTIMTITPDRLTSTDFESFTSNLILTFKLEAHQLLSYFRQEAKIQISYSPSGYLAANKGCTVSTHLINEDNMFSFYCQVDTVASKIKIYNRYFDRNFSAGDIIQVVFGVVNLPAATPATFNLKLYKWYYAWDNYGLLIDSSVTYTPTSFAPSKLIQQRSQLRHYPFYTTVFSGVNAPFRMTFKFPITLTVPLDYVNDLTQFFILDQFDQLSAFTMFQCYIKQYTLNPTSNTQLPHPNGYRNYKQNTQYFFVPTYCIPINATALRIQIPRNRPLDSTKFYELVVMPVSALQTGFTNAIDPLAKLVTFPVPTAQHIFNLKPWTYDAFRLNAFWIVTTRPLEPTAFQISFSAMFPSALDFPDHYIQIVFNNLDLTAIMIPYNDFGQTVPCSLTAAFKTPSKGSQKPNCIVTYADMVHQVLKVRVQNFADFASSTTFKLSLDYFFLPSITGLLQQTNPFTICMKYWSVANQHQRCFGQLFMIDGYTNTLARNQLAATFVDSTQLRYGSSVSPSISLAYPKTSTSQRNQKIMIRITGGFSATLAAPLSFSGSSLLWYNSLLNLYIQRQNSINVATAHSLIMSGVKNPYPYQMEQYMLGNTVQMTYFSLYHPHSHYIVSQTTYPSFIQNTALVKIGAVSEDIISSIASGTQAIVKITIQIPASYSLLTLHQNDRFQLTFTSNVAKVKRCWVNTPDNVAYAKATICSPKPSFSTKLQLLNFFQSFSNHNFTIYAVLQITGSPISIKSQLFTVNDQIQFISMTSPSISSVSSTMTAYTQLSFTESHYMKGYYQQIITPITHTSTVEIMYISLFLPETQVQVNSVFTIALNPATMYPTVWATNPRLMCEWLKVNKYGRQYQTGKFSVCSFVSPNIVINAPIWSLPSVEGSGIRIPYLLKIRQQSPTASRFVLPITSQVQEIILQSNTGGIFKKDTLIVHPYQHFNGLVTRHTTLSINELDTYHIEFATPTTAVGAGTQYVLTLQIHSKYIPDTLGVKDIYNLYGEDDTNSSIVNNLGLNMIYTSLPNKWINGIPYSCYTNQGSAAQQTCLSKSDTTVRINLLLASFTANMIWKVPLLKNPATQKPLRMNLTLWAYPGSTAGYKELFYQIINQHVTKTSLTPASVAYDIEATVKATNIIQTATNSLNIQFATFAPTPTDIVQVKLLPRTVGLIDIPSFWSPSFIDPSYNFFFFKNINFLIAQRNMVSTSKIINLGAIQVSNNYADEYGYEWLKVHSFTTTQTTKAGAQLKLNMPACSIPTLTFSLLTGSNIIRNGMYEGQIIFTTPCLIPLNSTLKLIAPTTDVQFLLIPDQSYCETSFRSKDCWLDASNNLFIRIQQDLVAAAQLTITTFFRSKSAHSLTKTIQGQIYAIPQKSSTLVNTISTVSIFPATTSTSLSAGAVFPLLIKPLYENRYSKITGTFKTGHLSFTRINLISPFSKIMSSNQTFFYQANVTGSPYLINEGSFNGKWIRTLSTVATNFDSTQTILPDGINSYAIQTATQYWFVMGSMYETSGDFNNFLIGPVGAYYQFQYRTDKQITYHQVYPFPVSQIVTVVNPLTQVGQETVIGVQFISALQDIYQGDKIQIQLDSHNLIENMYTFTNDAMECIQFTRGILTNNLDLVCQVVQYPDSATNVPLKLYVYPTKTVPMGTPVKIWISPIINSVNVLVAGVTVKVQRPCSGEKLCTMYEGRGWYRTTNFMTVTNYGMIVATFAPNPTQVLYLNAMHTYTFTSINLAAAFIKYPQNYKTIMPLTCTTGGICLVFPKQRKIVAVQAAASVSSLAISGLTNGIYVIPQNLIDMKLSSATNLDKYLINHGPLTTRQNMPLLGAALNTFTITNTQNTGAIFLRNYWNTVKMQIEGLYTSEFIKAFYIIAPVEVTDWDQTYCNATMESLNHNPYPTRLDCTQINTTTIMLKIPQGVYYDPGVSQTQTLTVYAKFWIQDFPVGQGVLYVSLPIPSADFNAYGSFEYTTQKDSYFITQAFTPIMISQHKTPLISQVAFNTESFEERLASVNDPSIFQILMDPITTDPIDYIELVIPEQFNYPSVLYHDMCQLIYRRTTDIPLCKQIRRDNQTIITMDIDQTLYDNGPRILQVGSKNITNWFTAPSLPGYLYNMTISLYGTNGSLLEKQSTKNSSRIKGYDFKLNAIVVSNGQDQLQEQIYDITFVVGSVGIKQGYRGILAKGQFFSELKIKFQTVEGYEYLLGGYYQHGDRVGCITSLSSINKQIACIFDQGTSINDEPSIIISNYEQVAPGASVKVSLANIKNLPSSLRNTLAIQVKYYKIGDETQLQMYSFNMYEPTQAIIDATVPISYTAPNALTVSYPGQKIVNEPTTFQIILNPSVTITDYIVVKFPRNGLRDEYSRFNVQCPNCAKVQIFYRAQVIRIYPLGGVHNAGTTITYTLTGFPSTQYTVEDPAYSITVQGYSGLNIVNKQSTTIALIINGCKLNSGIISATSPYGGDTGVSYTFEVQVNSSQLSRTDETKQLNMNIKLPNTSVWFSVASYCKVQLPLECIIDTIQQRLVVKNLLLYTKPSVIVKTYNLLNPPSIIAQTNLTFASTLFQQKIGSSITAQSQNIICLGTFLFTYLPSPPNKCSLSISPEHQSTIKLNLMSFGIVCQQAIKNGTYLYLQIPRQITFNNPISNLYKCWSDTSSILLDSSCRIIFLNGSYYFKTVGNLNIDSNVLEINLNIVLNNPLVSNTYVFGSTLQHSGNFYSKTNNVNLTFYTASTQPQLNSSISLQVIPSQAGAQAIYVLRVPSQILNDKLQLTLAYLESIQTLIQRFLTISQQQTQHPQLPTQLNGLINKITSPYFRKHTQTI